MTARRLPPPLLALSPGSLEAGDAPGFLLRLRRGVEAGLRGVLLREARLDDGPFLDLAREVAAVLEPTGGWLGLHDRVHLVHAAQAHGIHLGFRSLAPDEVRSLVHDGVAIGLSTHAGDGPEAWAAADYRFYAPVFDTPSKRGLVEPVGPAGLAAATAQGDGTPVWALGGLEPGDGERGLGRLRGTGARGAALLSGLLGAADVARAVRDARAALDGWEGIEDSQGDPRGGPDAGRGTGEA